MEHMVGSRNTGLSNKESSPLDLNRYAPFYIRSISNKLARGSTRIFGRHFGIGLGEWSCLALLAMEGKVSASRISEVSGYDKAAISRSVNALAKKGLVEMQGDPEHGRKRLISLTASGSDIHARITRIALEREARLLSDLTDVEQVLMLRLLCTLNERATAMLVEDEQDGERN